MAIPVAGFNVNKQNINLKGAPKKEWTMKSIIIEALEEVGEDGEPKNKKIAKKLVSLAERGDTVAIKMTIDRVDGMPQQSMKHSGEISLPTPIYGAKSTE